MDSAASIAVVTGAAGGIGSVVCRQLREKGWTVIGADLRGADIDAELTSQDGRNALIAEVQRRAPSGIDLVVACAGLAGDVPARMMVGLNFFGVTAILEGLRPSLARRPGAKAIAISSTAAMEEGDAECIRACLADDEPAALDRADLLPDDAAYPTSKRALSLWIRQSATQERWAGSGISLNAIAPGVVRTAMSLPFLETAEGTDMLRRVTPIAVPDYAEPWVLAEAVVALASLRGAYLVGQILYVDGGADALRRPGRI